MLKARQIRLTDWGVIALSSLCLVVPAVAEAGGFRTLPHPEGGDVKSWAFTGTLEVVGTMAGTFIRSVGSTGWVRSPDSVMGKTLRSLLGLGDSVIASNGPDSVLVSRDGGKSFTAIICPGNPLALCRMGFFCQGPDNQGLYRSTDLGRTWTKLSDQGVSAVGAWKKGIVGITSSQDLFQWDSVKGITGQLPDDDFPKDNYQFLNVGDSLFAWGKDGGLYRRQAGNDRWINVWASSQVIGSSPFGIALIFDDSLYWSRDFGKNWKAYPAPAYPANWFIGVEANRVWSGTNPIRRLEANGSSWIPDVQGMNAIQFGEIAGVGNRLLGNGEDNLFQMESLNSSWRAEGPIYHIFGAGNSVLAWFQSGSWIRYDSQGGATPQGDPNEGRQLVNGFVETEKRIFALTNTGPLRGTTTQYFLKVSPIEKPDWKVLYQTFSQLNWMTADGDRILLGALPPLYSGDGGNSWSSCPALNANSAKFCGGAFLVGTTDGIYRAEDPRSDWTRIAFPGIEMKILDAHGDTVVARDAGRLLISFDAGRRWWRVDPPFAPGKIRGLALAGGSLCVTGPYDALFSDLYCGSLSGLSLTDGIRRSERETREVPHIRLNWGRFEGARPGIPSGDISVGADGRVRPVRINRYSR